MTINVIITGATGMIGRGVLQECLNRPKVASVLVITRSSTGIRHNKLRELIHSDFYDWSAVEPQLKGYNACFFCLGTSALGKSEKEYTHVTYSLTVILAATLQRLNPDLTFVYVSGMGTDSSERGRSMWARVKGKTENAVLNMGFRDAYAFRPGMVLPEQGIQSRTDWYRALYTAMRPLFPLLKKLTFATTTSRVGQAMIWLATQGDPNKHVENKDINRLAQQSYEHQKSS